MSTYTRDVLRAIKPGVLQEHLRSRGWVLKDELSAKHGVVVYERDGVALDVPMHVDYADYSRRAEELVAVLARVEAVSMNELIDDLTQPIGDVLALRVHSDLTAAGTLPLDDAIRIRLGAKHMLLSAAHSTLSAQPWFPRMSRGEAVSLLSSVHEGQTQRGSFTARFIVPVEPAVGQLPLDEEPYGRRVVMMLFRALESIRHVRSLGAYEELLGMEKDGVSGNLLSALASMTPQGGAGSLDFTVSWAGNRRRPTGVVSAVSFPREALVGLDAAAEAMRGQVKSGGFEVVGYVTRLDRPDRDRDTAGEVTLAPSEGEARELRRVSVHLDASSYAKAIKAHESGSTIRVVGTLQKSGRRWTLADATGFDRLEESDEN